MSDKPELAPDRLDRALAELPPTGASPEFTQRVMAALDDAGDRRDARPWLQRPWALAAAAALAVAVGIFLGARPEPPVAGLAAERADLRQQHDELLRELESLRSLARETRPVIYLGSGDDVDYVLDLSPLVERSPSPTTRPAGLDETGPDAPRYY